MEKANKVVLVGGGGHAWVVANTLELMGENAVEGFFDDNPNAKVPGLNHLGLINQCFAHHSLFFHIALGNGELRKAVFERLSFQKVISVLHPRAFVSRHAAIGQGCFVGPCAVVNAGAELGQGTIVNSGAIVEHHAMVGNFAHVSYGAIVCAGARVMDGAVVPPGFVVNRGTVFGE